VSGPGPAPRGPIEMICIACPVGCRLTVTPRADGIAAVEGNKCPRGEVYGREELLSPRRVVTAVVPTDSVLFPYAPVRTDQPLARDRVPSLLERLYASVAKLPVRMGGVFIEDFHGVRVLFTRSLPPDDVPPVGEPGAEAEGEDQVPPLQEPL
jgi:CxxC motif-containing protein